MLVFQTRGSGSMTSLSFRMSFGGGGDFLKSRLRAQETSYTREMDKHAIKSIRDALKGTNELEAARQRLEEVRL